MKSGTTYLYKNQTFKLRRFFSLWSRKTPHHWTIRREGAALKLGQCDFFIRRLRCNMVNTNQNMYRLKIKFI